MCVALTATRFDLGDENHICVALRSQRSLRTIIYIVITYIVYSTTLCRAEATASSEERRREGNRISSWWVYATTPSALLPIFPVRTFRIVTDCLLRVDFYRSGTYCIRVDCGLRRLNSYGAAFVGLLDPESEQEHAASVMRITVHVGGSGGAVISSVVTMLAAQLLDVGRVRLLGRACRCAHLRHLGQAPLRLTAELAK